MYIMTECDQNTQAAKAALAAARQAIMQSEAGPESAAPAAPLPAFGSGIQFRPRAATSSQAPAPSGHNADTRHDSGTFRSNFFHLISADHPLPMFRCFAMPACTITPSHASTYIQSVDLLVYTPGYL